MPLTMKEAVAQMDAVYMRYLGRIPSIAERQEVADAILEILEARREGSGAASKVRLPAWHTLELAQELTEISKNIDPEEIRDTTLHAMVWLMHSPTATDEERADAARVFESERGLEVEKQRILDELNTEERRH